MMAQLFLQRSLSLLTVDPFEISADLSSFLQIFSQVIASPKFAFSCSNVEGNSSTEVEMSRHQIVAQTTQQILKMSELH